jgi:hypothetical protein
MFRVNCCISLWWSDNDVSIKKPQKKAPFLGEG